MYKEIQSTQIMKTIGVYTIVKCVEKHYFGSRIKFGKLETWYDVCLDNGDGDIVYSCTNYNEAKRWAREN